MSVIWESKCRLCRRAKVKLFLKGDRCYTRKCALEQRAYPPGQHGPGSRDRRLSEFGEQLREKQKLRWIFHLREKQFRLYVEEAQRRRGVTGEELLRLLETRLDSVVHRLGWASSRAQARQMVAHRFFTLNGRRVNIPSYRLRPGDVVAVHDSKRDKPLIRSALARLVDYSPPPWLALDLTTWEGKLLRYPEREELGTEIDIQKIIEFYSR